MERSWWWKAIGILFLFGAAVVCLMPSLLGEDRMPSWYSNLIKTRLQLGLDLQGGIHLVYEVEVDKAVSDKADRLSADIEERLRKLNAKVKIVREGRDHIKITFAKPADLSKADKKFMADYRYNLQEVARDKVTGLLHLTMESAYVKEVQDYAVGQAIETIRGRVDQFGVAEPSIRAKGRDIVIELPGLKKADFERVKKNIGRTAQLEFKMVDDESDFMQKVAAKLPKDSPIKAQSDSYNGKQRGSVSYAYLESRDKKALEQFIADLPTKYGLKVPATHEIAFGSEQAKDEKGNNLPEKVWVTYYNFRRSELTGEYITDAEPQWDDRTGRPEVGLTFDQKGARIFERLSGDNIGKRMAIMLDGKVNSAPVFQSRIGGGRARITLGGFKDPFKLQQDAKDLVKVLRAGALPAPLRKVFETQVGPTLGADAVRRGLMAFSIGGMLVILFMLYYYRVAGMICDVALVINFVLIMGVLSLFDATLTLPGIAGLVLTVGMAVDANVIIYERIREELALGKTPRAAVDAGYGRAFWTIFDAQLTTAIAAFVLMQYGSGPIRGFAVTLLAGIICSIFTGVVVTRVMFDLVVGKFRPKSLSI